MTNNMLTQLESSEIVTRFSKHTAFGGVHTFDVVPAPGGDRYFGYAGPLMDGPVDLFVSDDLETWKRYADNPILNQPGFRWPSVTRVDGTYFMAVRSPSHPGNSLSAGLVRSILRKTPTNRALFTLFRAKEKFAPTLPTSISLYRSEDGINFTRVSNLVDPYEHDNERNQNPFLLDDPNTDRVGLLYYSGGDSTWTIRHRLFDPATAEVIDDVELIEADSVLAAPAAFYHPVRSEYVLFAEAVDERTGDWITVAYTSDDLSTPIDRTSRRTVFSDDEACPFPFVVGDSWYLFLSKRHQSGLFPYWEGQIRRYDLM